MTVGSGGRILVRASTFAGNYSITGKTLSAGSTVDYAASGDQTVLETLTYSTLRVSGSGVKTLAGTLPALVSSAATSGNLEVAAGTLNLSSFTVNRGATVAGGTVSVAAGASLKIGGTGSFPANYATHTLLSASTVEYNGGIQAVTVESYGNLILSSSTASAYKTMPGSTMTVAGNLSSATNAPGASIGFTNGAAVTVNGSVILGAGTTNSGGSFAYSIGGNWTNNGTFIGASSALTLSGANAFLTGSGSTIFNDLTLANSGITADANTSLTVAGNLATSGLGTFTHPTGGSGTVTMSGTSKSISGTGIMVSKLTISGSTTTTASFTVADYLTVNGSLSASAGTITLSGTSKTISGAGNISFNALTVSGSITTTSSFSLLSDFNVTGSFTASAGTATFAGTTTFSGTASLFSTTITGTLLRMGAGSTLRLTGTATLPAAKFDATTQLPNTMI